MLKKTKLTYLFLSLFVLSCNNEDSDLNLYSKTKVEEVLQMEYQNEQKLAYSLLSETEKFSIWSEKFHLILNDNELYGKRVELTSKQRSLIKELNIKISEGLFISEGLSDDCEYFKNIFVPDFVARAMELFTSEEFDSIFVKLSGSEKFSKINSKGESAEIDWIEDDNGEEDCNCNDTSAFSCSYAPENCRTEANRCKETPINCGFLLLYECNGECSFL